MTADINTNSNDLGCNLNDLGINGAVTFSRRITPKSEVMEKLSNVPKVVNVYPPHIVELFGGQSAFEKIPVLSTGNSLGLSGYIDYLCPADLSAPLMKGHDVSGRPFVTMKLVNKRDRFQGVLTLFKRHIDPNSTYWCVGSNCSPVIDDDNKIKSGFEANVNNTDVISFVRQIIGGTQDNYELAPN